jgi:APA family basic amino acid/polyamine antiporter
MYGEVRGATSVPRTFMSMMMANLPLNIAIVLVYWGVFKSAGYEFFQSWCYGWWGGIYGYATGPGTLMPPSVALYPYFLTGSVALTVFICFFNAWAWMHTNGSGNGFLVVTRMMFAMSFDRLLPSWFASLSTRYRVPLFAMIWTGVVATILSYLYSFNVAGFQVLFLDATLTLLIAFFVTAIAAVILPFKMRDLWKGSPASKYTALFVISALIFMGYSIMIFYYWIVDANYGVNNIVSAIFLACIYAAGLIVYFAFKYYRKSQGINISKVFKEVPAE